MIRTNEIYNSDGKRVDSDYVIENFINFIGEFDFKNISELKKSGPHIAWSWEMTVPDHPPRPGN